MPSLHSEPESRSAVAWRRWAGWAASWLLALAAAARILEHYVGSPDLARSAGLLAVFLVLSLAAPLLSPQGGRIQDRRSRRSIRLSDQRLSAPETTSQLRGSEREPSRSHPAARPRPKHLDPLFLLPHAYFILQSSLVVILLFVPPYADFVTALFVALALQAALVFPRRALAAWVAVLALLVVVPALFAFGALRGLALTLIPAVACVVLPAFVVAYQEIEAARLESQRLLDELQAAQRRLQAYAVQAEELAALETRQRLARELHDSVSQTLFSLSLNARAARLYLERDPDRLRPQLERLQSLAHAALSEIRGLIEHLRPASGVP
jgi:hypothetical protein